MLTFLRMIGWRNLLIVIMALALVLLIRRSFFGQSQQEIRVNALFDQVDFVQELNLVTYYSEELLQIGGQDDIKHDIRSLETRQRDLQEEEIRLQAHDRLGQRRDSISSSRLLGLRDDLRQQTGRLDHVRDLLRDYPRLWAGIRGKLRKNPNAFGGQVAGWYRHMENLGRSDEANRFEQQIKQEVEAQATRLADEKSRLEAQISRIREQIRIEERSLKSIRQERNQHHEALVKLQLELEQTTLTLRSRQEELAAIDSLADSRPVRQNPPKLMAVVATGVSARTDLSQLNYEIIQDSILHFSCLPQAEIDPRVEMNLAGEKGRFSLLSGRFNGLFNPPRGEDGNRESIYLMVYREMKAALESMRQEVILNALQRGILEEADGLTRSYLEETGHALGFARVTFGAPCEAPHKEGDVSTEASTDQGQETVDSLLQEIGEIKE